MPYTGAIAGVAGVLVLTALAAAQNNAPQNNAPRSPWKYYPMDRATGDGGPAPKRDLTGTWAGESAGAQVPRGKPEVVPPLTPLGKQLFARNKPIGRFSPGGTNDPHTRYCDPFGFPQNMTEEIRGMTITTMPTRTFLLLQYMDLWREIWTDGRALPTNVGGRGPHVARSEVQRLLDRSVGRRLHLRDRDNGARARDLGDQERLSAQRRCEA